MPTPTIVMLVGLKRLFLHTVTIMMLEGLPHLSVQHYSENGTWRDTTKEVYLHEDRFTVLHQPHGRKVFSQSCLPHHNNNSALPCYSFSLMLDEICHWSYHFEITMLHVGLCVDVFILKKSTLTLPD